LLPQSAFLFLDLMISSLPESRSFLLFHEQASPPHYQFNPIKTLKTNVVGTVNMLGLARRVKARILIASTSGFCSFYFHPSFHHFSK
jgi:nucleoside-diphosphate-sugar epimerase